MDEDVNTVLITTYILSEVRNGIISTILHTLINIFKIEWIYIYWLSSYCPTSLRYLKSLIS